MTNNVDADERALLLAVRPRFAQAILNGDKTVELRRQRPVIAANAPVFLYASSPTKALVGSAWLAAVDVGSPDQVWDMHGPASGIDRSEYDGYFHGAHIAVALTLTAVMSLPDPVSLSELRAEYALEPPQSYRFIDATRSRRLLAPRDTVPRQPVQTGRGPSAVGHLSSPLLPGFPPAAHCPRLG